MHNTDVIYQMLLNGRDASKRLAVCERTLANLVRRGEIRAVRIGRAVRYDPRDIQRFIDEHKADVKMAA